MILWLLFFFWWSKVVVLCYFWVNIFQTDYDILVLNFRLRVWLNSWRYYRLRSARPIIWKNNSRLSCLLKNLNIMKYWSKKNRRLSSYNKLSINSRWWLGAHCGLYVKLLILIVCISRHFINWPDWGTIMKSHVLCRIQLAQWSIISEFLQRAGYFPVT